MDWKAFPDPAPELPHLFYMRRLSMPEPDKISDPATTDTKPGYKSTEFWITVIITVLGAVMASGLLDPNDPQQASIIKLIGLVLSVAGTLGYTAQRGFVKATQIKSAAFAAVELARAEDSKRDPSGPAS